MTNQFNIACIEHGCRIYGPGSRTVVWFQGCDIRCPGCWNSDMWDSSPNILMKPEELFEELISDNIDGVTFLGGEPLLQAELLFPLMCKLHDCGIHIMLYTGHELEEIASSELFKKTCSLADILIPGRYRDEERDTTLKWRGSGNQTVIGVEVEDGINMVEIRIDETGGVCCMGYPDDQIRSVVGVDQISNRDNNGN